jgi:drug/metabolite transporter (DMT)-like permease
MLELWIPITIAAALFQNIRSSLQKHLKGTLSTLGATYVRFFYAVPFVLLYLTALKYGIGLELPEPNSRFLKFAALGGVTQILGTALLIHLFSFRNFVVGTAYSKTETIQAAVVGMFVLSDPITSWGLVAILVSLAGVMLLALADQDFRAIELVSFLLNKTAGIGIACGAAFGIAAVSYRAASLSLGTGFVLSAACTLAVVLVLQATTMGVYLYLKEPGQLTAVLKAWRVAGIVGLAGMLASAGWFTAMTIQNAAHVRALGQVELIFAFLASVIFFHEKIKATEIAGVILIVAGILVLLFWA